MAEIPVQRRRAGVLVGDLAPPEKLNGALATTFVIIHLFFLFAMPLWLLPHHAAWGGR